MAVATRSAPTLPPRVAPSALMQRQRPLFLGLSFGHPLGGVGSIGPFVKTTSQQVGILSISFLLSPKGAKPGDRIHQPGMSDADLLKGSTRAATLSKVVAPEPGTPTGVAAALALLLSDVLAEGNVLPSFAGEDAGRHIGGALEMGELRAGDEVAFIGCGSGYSRGIISAVGVGELRLESYVFKDLVAVAGEGDRFSRPGDMGALVYRRADGKAVGLVFAGADPDGRSATYLLPLGPALRALEVTWL